MISSRAYRWSIIVLLLLTAAWKIAIPQYNPNDLQEEIVGFFERNSFRVVVTSDMVNHVPIIQASTDECRLLVARLTPDGWNRDLIRSYVNTDRLLIVFMGQVYVQQPIFWTVVHYLWSRFLFVLGFVRHITPVIAVGANSSCDVNRLPWGELYQAS